MALAALTQREQQFDAIRRRVGLILAPLTFMALLVAPLPSLPEQAHTMAAVGGAAVVLWVTEAIPLAVTAWLAPALAAVLGVAEADVALAPFADPLIFLFLGGFLLAGALARQGFDRRAALWLISRRFIGGSPALALAAIVFIAFVFSMWISNTATTAMLIPVALGLHATMKASAPPDEETGRQLDRFAGGMCLCLAYGASLGGMATPIGTGPNVIAVGMIAEQLGTRIDFVQWMSFALPIGATTTVIMVVLALRRFRPPFAKIEGLADTVTAQLRELGPMGTGERRAVGVFGLTVLGWLWPSICRLAVGPEHAASVWARANLDEGVVAVLGGCLLFAVPAGPSRPRERLLTWSDAQSVDWGTLFLLGGGLALGKLTFVTGLADAIGRGVVDLAGPLAAHPWGLSACAVFVVLFLTEVTSNTATTSMMLPVLIGICGAAGFDPVPVAVAVTMAASMAFMLPVSTPPNAMAYGTRLIRVDAMLGFGWRMDLIGLAIIMIAVVGFLSRLLP